MLGFGFNKAKILASAEKNVRQGKLQNAITEYEKIVKEDPKDLYVLNTIGDLYSRLGDSAQAAEYFQRVGEAYESDGFTVRAIAMYKKLTKQTPDAFEVLQKLAGLYIQQGLHNDARVQYAQVAEHFLHKGDNASAARILQKILELDPENVPAQSKLAELFLRTGRKSEARDIYLRSAHALHARGALEAADAAVGRVLELEPAFPPALLLRGQMKLDAGDAQGAIQCLQSVTDLDSRVEGLRLLLHAHLKLSQFAEAEPIARKLISVFHDTGALMLYADSLAVNANFEDAIRIYQENAAELLRTDTATVLDRLHNLIAAVKDNPQALEALRGLFQQAGSTTHLAEVTELLAHAWVKAGELTKARDLYRGLAEMEPENPLHMQNYLQVLAQLGEEQSPLASVPVEEGPARLAAELDEPPVSIDQGYSPEVAASLQQALTDSELYLSYSLPARAIAPLEIALGRAPRDVQVNQRLAALYARSGRPRDAVRCCLALESAYAEAGRPTDSRKYAELARRLHAFVGAPDLLEPAPVSQSAPSIAESPSAAADWFDSGASTLEPFPEADEGSLAHEIDLSEEWERAVAHDRPEAGRESGDVPEASSAALQPSPLEDIVEEARFYLSQGMNEEARAALARAEAVAPDAPSVVALRGSIASATEAGSAGAPTSSSPDTLDGFVHDLELSLSQDFQLATEPTVSGQKSPAATGVSGDAKRSSATELNLPAGTQAPEFKPIAAPPFAPQPEAANNEGAGLADLFAEFKHDLESSAAEDDDDPETHYNLGIAFKEMGLMDEAIGELQKVCQAIDRGSAFPQKVEAYTWLAHCFLETGVPEAGIRWYEKALQLPGLGSDSTLALHYELGCAHEAAGHAAEAQRHFMQVLSVNIDYRDVAERIKALKS